MTRSRYQVLEQNAPHFLTCTVIQWLPIFTRPKAAQILIDSLKFLREERKVKIYGYVILENHLHWVAASENLSEDIFRFKSFTARQIIDYLIAHSDTRMLEQLAFYKQRERCDRKYQLWQEGAHPEWIQNQAMMVQKMEYIHLGV